MSVVPTHAPSNRPLRVLWFTNTVPAAWRQGTSPDSGFWLDALESALRADSNVDLAVAGVTSVGNAMSEFHGARYFSVTGELADSRIGRLVQRWTSKYRTESAIDACLAVIEAYMPDLIHIHGTEHFFGSVLGRTDVPALVAIQGVLSEIDPVYLSGLQAHPLAWIDPRRIVNATSVFHGRADLRRRAAMEHRILADARFVCGRTEWDRNVCAARAPQATYYHLDEIMRPEFYGPRWRSHTERSGTILYTTMGSAPYKGLETLVDSLARLTSQGVKVCLRVGGNIDQSELGVACRRIARHLGVSELITELGPLGPGEIVTELLNCDVYVSPSHADNSPNSLCEAQLVGVPCVAAAVGGVPSLVEDGVTGLLFDDGDAMDLSDKVLHLVDGVPQVAGLGEAARCAALRRHDRDAVVAQTVDLYRTIVQDSEQGRVGE